MQTIRITTSQNIDIDYEVGGLGERIIARLIDLAIFGLVMFLGLMVVPSLGYSEVTLGFLLIAYAVLFVFYDLVCEVFMNGQSVGKKVMKIKVMSADGAQPRLGQYLMRWLFRIVDFGIGFGAIAIVVAALSENGQRIGDLVAGTIMIRTEPRTGIDKIAFHATDSSYEPVFMAASQLNDHDVELINEVITSYVKTGNSMLVYNMALRIKQHLSVTLPDGMNDMVFLQTVLKDYTHLIAQAEP